MKNILKNIEIVFSEDFPPAEAIQRLSNRVLSMENKVTKLQTELNEIREDLDSIKFLNKLNDLRSAMHN